MKWIAILILAVPIPAVAGAEPEFHLCSAYVQQSVMGDETTQGWPVYVKLTDVGAASLASFTEANIGTMARIVFDGWLFLRATIQAPIIDGTLQGRFCSYEVATEWQKILKQDLPEAPCGVN